MDGRLLALARADKEAIRRRSETEDARRRRDVYARIPALRETDAKLAALVGETARAAAGNGRPLADIRAESLALQARRAELLAENGLPADWLDGAWACKRCRDTGYADGRMCSCLRELYDKRRADELSALLNLGDERFETFDLSYYPDGPVNARTGLTPRQQMEDIFGFCRDYAEDFGPASPNLLMRGGTGLGKTFLSACIARAVSARGFSVVYETTVAAMTAYEDQKFRDKPEAEGAIRRLTDCDLLILDDLGTEMTTEFTKSALYTLLNARLLAGKKTIVSTNLPREELERRYTPAIASRLGGDYQELPFVGRDIRPLKRARGF